MLKKLLNCVFVLSVISVIYWFFPTIYTVANEICTENPKCNLASQLENDMMPSNAGCVILDGDNILLVKLYNENKYSIPGGTYKSSESSPCTAHRETYEETGINTKILKRLFIADNGFHVFLCQKPANINLDYYKRYEIDEILFMPINEVQNYKYPRQLEKIKQYMANRNKLNSAL